MPHFFIHSDSVTENNLVTISDNHNYRHIAKSLRAKVGEPLLLIDENQIQYECRIKEISDLQVIAEINNRYKSSKELGFELYLAQSPLRSNAQNFIIEKATELGVKAFFPIMTDKCALNKISVGKKIKKWENIMVEASKQCERAQIPKCFGLTDLRTLLETLRFNKILVFCECNANFKLKDFLASNPIKNQDRVLVIIGPEGGFSDAEFKLFAEKKLTTLTLGELILKAETAVVVALGNIIYDYNYN